VQAMQHCNPPGMMAMALFDAAATSRHQPFDPHWRHSYRHGGGQIK